jgi:hypothetical protein
MSVPVTFGTVSFGLPRVQFSPYSGGHAYRLRLHPTQPGP